jgi:hypothetical protein
MRGRSSGKTGPPVPGLTRVGGGAKNLFLKRLYSVGRATSLWMIRYQDPCMMGYDGDGVTGRVRPNSQNPTVSLQISRSPTGIPPSSISSHTANAVVGEQWTSCAAFDAHGSHAMVDCRHTAACVAVRSNQHTHEHKRQAQCSTWRAHSCTQHEISSTDRPRQTDSVYPRQPSSITPQRVCRGQVTRQLLLVFFIA